jgi:holin-like protein
LLFYITVLLVPGPVVGMVILFLALVIKGRVPKDLEAVGSGLLSHLSLLFVPAGVGVMIHLNLIATEWLPISAAVVSSTLVTIAVTAMVMSALGKRP